MHTSFQTNEIAAPPIALSEAYRRSRWADFLQLTKPRMNFLVLITTAVGFFMAIRSPFQWLTLVHALIGTAMTAAAASALNQYWERRYDAMMQRTLNRPLPANRLLPREALVFALVLMFVGVSYLAIAVNPLTAALGLFTLATYVLIYTPLKRRTSLNTIIGAVPGAIPPVMGWTAVTGALSPEAVALFLILFLWQMPHFLAIAILYRDDYARAGFRMLPVVDRDLEMTGRQILVYTATLLPATFLPYALRMTGPVYLVAAALLGALFLVAGFRCAARGGRSEARRLFIASVLYLPLLLAAMMIGKL